MEGCGDFLQWLGPDTSMNILMCLKDPSDLIRVCSVSSSWRRFARGLTSFVRKDCLSEAIFASSTDNYPEESIQNTLEPSDRVEQRASYWSSEGESDPTVPEILDYKLISKLCLITEIHVQPFQARAVRFRMGRPRSSMEIGSDFRDEFEAGRESPDYAFEWTYTSPEFPMAQENCLQKFKLPEPVLCIGGILQVELLGRVQRQELDGLFYIWLQHLTCSSCRTTTLLGI
ncbi:hypothetical protein CsSME_00029120 [Camellia sinensis var. sinensis]